MKKATHICFIITDGIGLRNYLFSKLPSGIDHRFEVTVWSTLPPSAFSFWESIHQSKLNYERLELKKESRWCMFLRETSSYARLLFNSRLVNNDTIKVNWRPKKTSFSKKVFYLISECLGFLLSFNYRCILLTEGLLERSWPKSVITDYEDWILNKKVDLLFITHQRVPALLPVSLAAKNIGTCVCTAIFSWDNVPKARLNVRADQYLLWSEFMRNEMTLFYREIPSEKLLITGTPQFDHYQKEDLVISRREFAAQYQLDENIPWICFSGDDQLTSPYDPIYLEHLAQEIEGAKLKMMVLFRRAPADFSKRFESVLSKYPDLIKPIDPDWVFNEQKGWMSFYPNYNDLRLQVSIAKHCFAVINLGSTMALDFACLNKPALYLDYDPSETDGWSTKIIYQYQHFRSMNGMKPVGWIKSRNDFVPSILNCLNKSQEIAQDRKNWLHIIAGKNPSFNFNMIANPLHQ